MIPLVDRHVFREWLNVFVLALALILGILVIEDIFDDLQDLLDSGAGTADVLRYYGVLIPSFLPSIVPLALLVSVLFSLGNLKRNSEITAMRAAGMSIWRITRSLWFVGVVLTGVLLYLQAEIVPWSVEEARSVRETYKFRQQLEETGSASEVGVIRNLTFFNFAEDRMWFLNRFSEYNYRGYGITVEELGKDGNPQHRLLAEEGYYDDVAEPAHWVFLNGREFFYNNEGEAIRSLTFDEMQMTGFTEDPTLMKFRRKDPHDLSLFELQRVLTALSPENDPRVNAYEVRYQQILANPLSCLIVVAIAVPFAVAGVRVNPMVGVAKALALFFGYYMMASIFSLMGSQGRLSPELAAWLPNAIALGAAFLFWRKIR